MCENCKLFNTKKYYIPEVEEYFKFCPFCGEKIVIEEETFKSFALSIKDTVKFREVYDLGKEYYDKNLDPNDYLDVIKSKLKWYKK
jgi:hypothetical protein